MSILTRTLPSAPGSYATAAEVRTMTGLSSTNDVSNADLEELILTATLDFIGEITNRVDGALASPTDTARVTFQLPTGLVADVTGDASVTTNDLNVRFVKENTDGTITTTATGTVTIHDATLGIFTTANALPQEYECIVDYAYYSRILDLNRAKRAVRYLAAHYAVLRVKSPGKVTRADLTGVGAPEANHSTQRTKFLELYRRQLASLRGAPVY